MKTYILLLLLIISFTACTERMDITLDSTFEKVVIEGSITDEFKAHQVKITKSADYFSNKPAETITGASVSISDGTNTFTLTETDPGIYETDPLSGIPGKTYSLNIDIGSSNFTASSLMHTCPPIDSLGFILNKYTEEGGIVEKEYLDILIYAQEPGNEVNFYAWNAYRNDTLVTDTLREVIFSDDIFINGSYINGIEVQSIDGGIGDTIILEMLSITEEFNDYMLKIMLETDWNSGPFDGPPANFYGNISNEALGFFEVYSVKRDTAIVPEDVKIEESSFF